jgi:hypothetical protein
MKRKQGILKECHGHAHLFLSLSSAKIPILKNRTGIPDLNRDENVDSLEKALARHRRYLMEYDVSKLREDIGEVKKDIGEMKEGMKKILKHLGIE